jgi:hypothetical protein
MTAEDWANQVLADWMRDGGDFHGQPLASRYAEAIRKAYAQGVDDAAAAAQGFVNSYRRRAEEADNHGDAADLYDAGFTVAMKIRDDIRRIVRATAAELDVPTAYPAPAAKAFTAADLDAHGERVRAETLHRAVRLCVDYEPELSSSQRTALDLADRIRALPKHAEEGKSNE